MARATIFRELSPFLNKGPYHQWPVFNYMEKQKRWCSGKASEGELLLSNGLQHCHMRAIKKITGCAWEYLLLAVLSFPYYIRNSRNSLKKLLGCSRVILIGW